MAFLLQLDENGVAACHGVPGGPVTIGRGGDNAIVLRADRVSRHHARLETDGGGAALVDLGSTHLSFVNGQPVDRAPLAHGDLISLGEQVTFLYLEREDPELVERVVRRRRSPLADAPESTLTGFVRTQMDTIMDEMRAMPSDAAALRRIREQVDRRVADLQTLYEIGSAINSELDLDRVLDLIVSHVVSASGAERGFVLIDGGSGELAPMMARDHSGPLKGDERHQYSKTIVARAVQSGKTVWTADTFDEDLDGAQSIVDFHIRSAICAPLTAKGVTLGALYVDAKQSLKRFDDRDTEFFAALASQSAIALENARLVDRVRSTIARLDRKVKELSTLYSISQSLLSSPSQDAMLATILDKSIEVLGSERGLVLVHGNEEGDPAVRMVRGAGGEARRETLPAPQWEGLAGQVAESGSGAIAPLDPDDPMLGALASRGGARREVLCVPLKRNQETIGVLALAKPAAPPYTGEDLQLMTSIASQAAVTIENSRLYNLAVMDGLTGLHVRRFFDAWLAKELERARRYGGELAVILIDIDHFKHVNDTYGHPAGDVVLKEVAGLLRSLVRSADLAARWGGEEFIIGLPNTTLEGAAQFAERLRQTVEAYEIRTRDDLLGVTISLGVCSLATSSPADTKELVKFADLALYAAKAGGRNRHVLHEPGMEGKTR